MALKLYMSTIRVVLDVDPANEDSWSRIYGSLCCLRQSLSCTSCQKLLEIPQRPIESECKHTYCKKCFSGKKFHCEFCKNSEFEEHTRFRIILQCYKKMCRYILSSGICRCWDKTKLTSPMLRFFSMVYQGAGLEDRYHYVSSSTNGPLIKKLKMDHTADDKNENEVSENSFTQACNVKVDDSAMNLKVPRVVIRKSALADRMLTVSSIPDASSDDSEIDCPKVFDDCLKSVKKRSCSCGMASRHPGNLTCCGQRCPCYVNGRACINCRCKGCRNPQKNLISSPPYYSDHYHDHQILKKTFVTNDHDSFSDQGSNTDSEHEISE